MADNKFGPVNIEPCDISEEKYRDGNKRWTMSRLIELSKDLPVFDLPLAYIDIDINPWNDTQSIESYAHHVMRIQRADLSYPVIMSQSGYIMNGWHRIVKALVEGRESVKAVRFVKNPPHCFTEEDGE